MAWVITVIALVLATSLLWPPASNLFRFGPMHAEDLLIALGAGLVVLTVLELLKPIWGRLADGGLPVSYFLGRRPIR